MKKLDHIKEGLRDYDLERSEAAHLQAIEDAENRQIIEDIARCEYSIALREVSDHDLILLAVHTAADSVIGECVGEELDRRLYNADCESERYEGYEEEDSWTGLDETD
jgi:hypothetical protein